VADGGKRFTVHVVARFKACLTRPVPAMLEPCAGAQTETAFSRAFETVELLLRPGLSAPKALGYHRLRQLFQLEDDDPLLAEVPPRRAQIQALPSEQQPAAWLQALREFAALDTIALQPQAATGSLPASLFPEDPSDLVLADVADIVVTPNGSGWTLATPLPVPVVTVRRSHIATATIQELLCGPLFGVAPPPEPSPAPSPEPAPAPPPAGPTITEASLVEGGLLLATSEPLAAPSVTAAAFAISDYDKEKGWRALDIKAVTLQADGAIRIDLASRPEGALVRIIARGTGPTPLLAAADLAPLGAPGASGADDGIDFVQMISRS